MAFLSHQWASFEHPDPDGVQYRTRLCRVGMCFFLGFKNFDEGERILGYAGLGLRGALSFVYSRSLKVGNPIASILKSNV